MLNTRNKSLKYGLVFFLFSVPFASASDINRDIAERKTTNEVILLEDGSELVFETTTLKPIMILEDHIYLTNNSSGAIVGFEYDFSIPKGLYYVETKESENIKKTYSSDLINYHSEIRRSDIHTKYIVNDFPVKKEVVLKIRYIHNMISY